MIASDWPVIVALFVVVAALGYAVGARARRPDDAPRGPGAAPRPAPRNEAAKPERSKPEPEATEAAPAASKTREAAPASSTPPARVEAAPTSARDGGVVRLDYEEDADIDPTKLGKGTAPSRALYQPPVERIVYDEDASDDEPTRAEPLFLISSAAQTDTGLRRKRNEDSVLVFEAASLFVVADGMGGYRGGELASQLAVKTIGDAFRHRAFEGEPHESLPSQASELARAIQMANAAILETAKRDANLEGMGTTVCAARFSGNKKRVYIGHVGDSRCYRLRNGVLKQMTADHTMADQGVRGPEAAHLSRAVGIWPTVPIDIVMGVPLADDVYLLCSDGLTKMLNDDVIATVLRQEEDSEAAIKRLILFANARGGKDNITVVLVRVVPPHWKPRPSVVSETEKDGALAGASAEPPSEDTT